MRLKRSLIAIEFDISWQAQLVAPIPSRPRQDRAGLSLKVRLVVRLIDMRVQRRLFGHLSPNVCPRYHNPMLYSKVYYKNPLSATYRSRHNPQTRVVYPQSSVDTFRDASTIIRYRPG